jgi:hypothetical protein
MENEKDAAEKGDEPPTLAEIETTLMCLLNIARLARLGPSDEELRRYIEAASKADTIAMFFDPTLWMMGSKKNELFLKIARALATFRASLPTLEEAVEADRAAMRYTAAAWKEGT